MRFAPLFLTSALTLASPALAEVPRVVTDFGPVQSLVADVMGDLGQPEMLLPPGTDPHDFQLRPSQAQALSQADLVFWVGPELMPEMQDSFATLAPQAQVVALLPVAAVTRDYGGDTHEEGEEQEAEAHADDHSHDHDHDHAEGSTDPHAWLDPANGQAWLAHIATVLGQSDPANAATYAANAQAAAESLAALDAELAAALTPVQDRPFIVYHDALGYFADHYGLALAGAIELGDAATPGAAQLARVQAVLQDTGAVCVFPESGRDPAFIAAITDGLQIRVGAAQDLEFLTLPAGPSQYGALLRAIAATLTDCLRP